MDPSPIVAAEPAPAAVGAASERITVVVADDHPLFRRGVARAIARHPRMELVAEAEDGIEALALIDAYEPAVAVLDNRMPGLTGIEVCGALAARPDRFRTAVLLLSAFEDVELMWQAHVAGAAGYVGKTASPSEVVAAIEAAAGAVAR